MPERMFPILWPYRREEIQALEALGCPREVPWSVVAPHEAQAQRNHSQTLERLAERGGLGPAELLAVLTDRPWREVGLDRDDASKLIALLSSRPT